jgi:uncharacterized protein YndB with AHSA1/START domain
MTRSNGFTTTLMNRKNSEDAVHRSVTVRAPAERAFAVFTEGFATWWLPAYTWARDSLDSIGIEPREGGHCFEKGPFGFHLDWGRVLVWEPSQRLVFTWQIGPMRVPQPNPDRASQVEVRFLAEGPSRTRVALEHRGFSRHGEGADGYRAGMDSPQGWTLILDRYAAAVA